VIPPERLVRRHDLRLIEIDVAGVLRPAPDPFSRIAGDHPVMLEPRQETRQHRESAISLDRSCLRDLAMPLLEGIAADGCRLALAEARQDHVVEKPEVTLRGQGAAGKLDHVAPLFGEVGELEPRPRRDGFPDIGSQPELPRVLTRLADGPDWVSAERHATLAPALAFAPVKHEHLAAGRVDPHREAGDLSIEVVDGARRRRFNRSYAAVCKAFGHLSLGYPLGKLPGGPLAKASTNRQQPKRT